MVFKSKNFCIVLSSPSGAGKTSISRELIKNDKTFWEKEPLEIVCKKKHLAAYKHHGFWQCVDTKRDLDKLKKDL